MSSDASTSKPLLKEDPLASLRSPASDATTFDASLPKRESLVTDSDFNDIALDDESGFSPVALTRGHTPEQDADVPEDENGRPRSMSSPQAAVFNPSKQPSHKKSASITTIRSANNLPFILARLDLQDESGAPHRGSVDGQQKLQEEFARLHREEEEAKDIAGTGAIDWGASSECGFWCIVPEQRFHGQTSGEL